MHAKTDSWILMKEEGNILIFGKRIFLFIVLTLLGGFITGVIAQPNPPRPITLTANNSFPLAFGAFSPGAGGGTVIISCLLYTSDAADDLTRVDLGGRR